jgi:tripartite-type tricarboxylate transporter receptor subunit TctC
MKTRLISTVTVTILIGLLLLPWSLAAQTRVDFPTKGKAIMLIVPYSAGAAIDIQARILASLMEKELATPVEVVNRPAGGAQAGQTDVAKAKPDGYTIGYTPLPACPMIYLDPERKAAFTRKSFQPLAMITYDPYLFAVKADSPYRTMKDLADAAKASPGKIAISVSAFLGESHLTALQFQQAAGVNFAIVNTKGGNEVVTHVLGGHAQAGVNSVGSFTSQIKGGGLRAVGATGKGTPFLPEVKTLEEQGYPVFIVSSKVISAPAGTPKEITDVLAGTIKKVMDSKQFSQKIEEVWMTPRYMGPNELGPYWEQSETEVAGLLKEIRNK